MFNYLITIEYVGTDFRLAVSKMVNRYKKVLKKFLKDFKTKIKLTGRMTKVFMR